jgi:predicted RNA polymerase sigma factor
MFWQIGGAVDMAERDRSRRDRSAALYDVLLRLDDNPVVAPARPRRRHQRGRRTPGRPRAGPASRYRPSVDADRRFYAVRGHLLVRAGHPAAALGAYRAAARVATNLQQQCYLN